MVFGVLKAQASSGVLRTNWSSRSSFPSSGRLFWPLYARSWHVAWVGGSRVAVHARAGIDFVRLRLPPCSSVPHQRPLPCPLCPYCPLCPWGRPRRAGRRLAPPGGGSRFLQPPPDPGPRPKSGSETARRRGSAWSGAGASLPGAGAAQRRAGATWGSDGCSPRGGLRCASRGRAAPLLRRLLPNSAGRVQLGFADGRWRTDQLTNQPGGFKKT